MSYVDEVLEKVVAKNPAEPEFHQAVKEVLESLRVVVEANEEKFRKGSYFRKYLLFVKEMRLELTRHNCHHPLKVARLPIPPFLQKRKPRV